MVPVSVRRIPAAAAGAGEEYFLPAQKLLQGNPRQTVWLQYTDPTGRFMAGIWHSEPGRWKILYTEEEYCQMLEGRSVITDDAGHAVTVGAGEEFIIPAGFSGSWEVLEPTRKRFVIYEPGVRG
ncbi:MAG TPA: cupin domain-containing protein [Steroidobacteraceae bacterium]|nr:cupin domain-containing protein [Steroidobacteraceae bacterium]